MRRLFPADLRHQRIGGGVQAPCEIALAKMRHEVFALDARCEGVGNRSLEAVSRLDAKLPVLYEDEEDQAVVVLLVADLPLLGAADGEVLERIAVERAEDVDDELCARRL